MVLSCEVKHSNDSCLGTCADAIYASSVWKQHKEYVSVVNTMFNNYTY